MQSFAKGKASDNARHSKRNAVIYTHVSTKEQADTDQSLETQKKYCLQYALKNDLNVLGFFGGTYESALPVIVVFNPRFNVGCVASIKEMVLMTEQNVNAVRKWHHKAWPVVPSVILDKQALK